MGDFLKRDVKTSLCGYYFAAGIRLRIETNSESILEIACANLEPSNADSGFTEDVQLKLWVDDEISLHQECRPYFRGLGHLVFSSYDDRSSLLIDLCDRCGAGRFTKALKTSLSGASRGRVVPAACIFLERQAASPPRLVPVPRWEGPKQNFTDAGSEEDRSAILALLGRVPAYRLLYDDDPSIAAVFFRSVVDAHQLMEQRV